MSLYPLWLNTKVTLKKVAIALHLMHTPTFSYKAVSTPLNGVCARYHADVDGSPTNLVIRAAVQSGAQLQTILDSGVKVVALIETLNRTLVEDIAMIAGKNPSNLVGIELGNEIDLTPTRAEDFGIFLSTESHYLRDGGFAGPIITGGISRVRPDTLTWLNTALTYVGHDVVVGIHRYSLDNDATIPQTGYVNRDDESNAIMKVANGRRVAITEFGYPLLDGYTQADLAKVLRSVQVDLDTFRNMGALFTIYYQWLNGPTAASIDRFGIQHQPDILGLLS